MKKKEVDYFIIIFILFLTNYMNKTFFSILKKNVLFKFKIYSIFLILIFCILFFIKNNIQKINIKKYITILICSIFLKKFYLSFFIIIISNFIKKIVRLKILLFLLTFFYILTLILNYLGYLEFNNLQYGIRKFENLHVYRHALGFNHPNTAMSLLIPIFSLFYYVYYPKYKKLVIVIIIIIGKIIFDLTFSRTTFLLIILFVILILIKDKYIEKLKILFLAETLFVIFITFYLTFYFNNSILNKLFSGRLWLFNYYLNNHKITLFGYKEIKELYEQFPLDNVYLRTLFENGILGFILLILLLIFTMYILLKNKDYKAIRIFSIILIFGFMEATALFYYFNIIYFIISDYIFINYKVKKYEKNQNYLGI